MPTYTPEFAALKTRLSELGNLIPSGSNTSASPTPREQDQMSAFVVLAHAACEEFMETRTLSVAEGAKTQFDCGGELGRVGKHLCVFPYLEVKDQSDLMKFARIVGKSEFGVMASSSFVSSNRADFIKLIHIGFNKYKKSVKDNHGASLKYQFKLLSKIGFDLSLLGNNFTSRIAQLATYRGEAAHAQVVAASTIPSPTTLATWPRDLIEGYRRMDFRLTSLATRKR